jgi:hypothetical protein
MSLSLENLPSPLVTGIDIVNNILKETNIYEGTFLPRLLS